MDRIIETIATADGATTTVDVTSVRDFELRLRSQIHERKFFAHAAGDLAAIKSMDKPQLERLAMLLSGIAREYAWLYDESFKPAYAKAVSELREVAAAAKAQGVELWPELLEETS